MGSEELGVPVAIREAFEWAILGALAQDGVDPALPAVTRRPPGAAALAGSWTSSPDSPVPPAT
jgi:hypothetical protein